MGALLFIGIVLCCLEVQIYGNWVRIGFCVLTSIVLVQNYKNVVYLLESESIKLICNPLVP